MGDFVEISLAVTSLSDATSVFEALGFQEIEPLQLPYPTAAYSDGEIRFSLHEASFSSPTITFFGSDIAAVRPVIEQHARAVQELQRESGTAIVISCRIPGNWRMILAAQRPPLPSSSGQNSRCGHFLELALPTHSMEDALEFWSYVGFQPHEGSEEPYRYARLNDGTLPLGLHDTSDFDQPACLFRTSNLEALINDLSDTGAHVLRNTGNRAAISLPGDLLFILSTS